MLAQATSYIATPKRLENKVSKRNEKDFVLEINVKKILAVINAAYAVAKRKPEKIRLPGKPDFFRLFFRLSFRNCIRCVNNCEDLLYIYFFIPQFKYMNFIYSQFQLLFGSSVFCGFYGSPTSDCFLILKFGDESREYSSVTNI